MRGPPGARGVQEYTSGFTCYIAMPAPILDVRTLVLIYVGVNIGLAAVLIYLWRVQKNYPPARDWAVGSLLFAIGLFLFALRTRVSPIISEILSNLFLLPGLIIFNYGVVKAAGQKPSLKIGLAFGIVAIGLVAWFAFGAGNITAASVSHNTVFVVTHLYTAYACLHAKTAKGNHTFRILAILFAVLALVCIWRVAGGNLGLTFSFAPTTPRLFWISCSLLTMPMIVVLLTLHTSQRLQEEIHAQARRDALTGAFNRRAFTEFADREWSRSVRHGHPFAVLSIDIDHFKILNDQHGHQTGDLALVQVSKAAEAALRADDIWCRHGGEEFVALLPDSTMAQAMIVAERLRAAVGNAAIDSPKGKLKVTVSVGVAEYTATSKSFSEVLAISDSALYQAKGDGRNRVVAGDAGSGSANPAAPQTVPEAHVAPG